MDDTLPPEAPRLLSLLRRADFYKKSGQQSGNEARVARATKLKVGLLEKLDEIDDPALYVQRRYR